MAEIKKYLDTVALGALVDQIKSEDAKVLASAKSYAEGLGTGYDVAGAAATVQGKLDDEIARAKAREDDVAALAEAAQSDVDALETYVGTLPEGTAAVSVVDYVNIKTAGIATDAALEELNNQVSGLQTVVNGVTADYLKAADKQEMVDAIAAEEARAKGIEGGLETRLKAVEDDYLVEADKTELVGQIDTISGKVNTLIGEDAGKSARAIANEELAKQLIAEGAAESLDTLAEIAAWIQSHPEDASAMNKAIEDLEALVGVLPEGVTATDVVGYAQEAVAAEQARAEGVESGFESRIASLESAVGEDGSVDDKIDAAVAVETAAREAAIAEVQEDADKGIADAAEALKAAQDAAASATALNDAMDVRMKAVEAAKHTHTNQAELDLIASGDKNKWDAAAAIAHEHSNKAVLDGITEAKVTLWDGVSSKASQADLDAAVANINANTSAINSFTAITSDEVNAMFA